jgi:hypothetical protein
MEVVSETAETSSSSSSIPVDHSDPLSILTTRHRGTSFGVGHHGGDSKASVPRQLPGLPTGLVEDSANKAMTSQSVSASKVPLSSHSLQPKEVAQYLISKEYLLTALEFYTELAEDGQEIREMKEYFSNPRNFESVSRYQAQPSGIASQPGQQSKSSIGGMDRVADISRVRLSCLNSVFFKAKHIAIRIP